MNNRDVSDLDDILFESYDTKGASVDKSTRKNKNESTPL